MMTICACADRGSAFASIPTIDLNGAQSPFGKAQDRQRAANRKRGHRCRATEPSSFLPDRTLTLHSISMTTQPTQSANTTSLEPTWTDVARAVFRSGKRQMSLDEFVRIFFQLFGELAERCSPDGVFAIRLYGAFEELEECGFIDEAILAEVNKGLDERKRSR